MEYAVIYEKTQTGYSAYVPDLPGCIAGGKTLRETASLMHKAISMHIEAMTQNGSAIPPATTVVKSVPVGRARRGRRSTSEASPRRAARRNKRGLRRSRVRAV